MTYIDQRDALLVHAKAAAIATDATWTNVAVGMPALSGSKGCRLFYGGEAEPEHMGESRRVLNGEMVASVVNLVAWWSLANLSSDATALVDSQIFTFVHEIRTRVQGDSQLGGKATDLAMSYADPDVVVSGGGRYAVIGIFFTTDYTEYALAP